MTNPEQDNQTTDSSLWTIRKVLNWSVNYLREKGSPSAQLDAELLLAYALQCKRIELYTQIDRPLSIEERSLYKEYIRRRALAEPVAYIIGTRAFWRHDFIVNKDVLIPRPETEVLLEVALDLMSKRPQDAECHVLDVCTGSGCLAVSMAKEKPNVAVKAWDISSPALFVAEQNAKAISAEIGFSKCNALDPMSWCVLDRFDVIISNPPYIGYHEGESVDHAVVSFEPKIALFADSNGYKFYEVFAEHAANLLNPGGCIAVEVGASQAGRVIELFEANGWHDVKGHDDLARITRVVSAFKGS